LSGIRLVVRRTNVARAAFGVRMLLDSSLCDEFHLERISTMAKYLFIYRDSAEPKSQPSPEEMQAFLAMWGEWFQKFGSQIVDGGDGLLPTGRVLKSASVVTDGPYVEAKEMIGGYSVIQADSYEGAVAVARECPIAKLGQPIEIRELAGFAS
jgi:hypothetical protein